MTESTEPTSGEFSAVAGAAVQLAGEVTDLHRRLREASTHPARRVGYRLADITGELRRISDGLCATRRELQRAQDVHSDPGRCQVEWGVCPEHGNTLTSAGGISTCCIDGRSWDYDRAASLCGKPVSDVITDPAGGANVICHGHAIAVLHSAGWSVRPMPTDPFGSSLMTTVLTAGELHAMLGAEQSPVPPPAACSVLVATANKASPDQTKGGTMTAMNAAASESDVNDVAREAGLTQEQTHGLRNVAASWAMEGMALTLAELRVGAELAAGRIDFAEARRRIGV